MPNRQIDRDGQRHTGERPIFLPTFALRSVSLHGSIAVFHDGAHFVFAHSIHIQAEPEKPKEKVLRIRKLQGAPGHFTIVSPEEDGDKDKPAPVQSMFSSNSASALPIPLMPGAIVLSLSPEVTESGTKNCDACWMAVSRCRYAPAQEMHIMYSPPPAWHLEWERRGRETEGQNGRREEEHEDNKKRRGGGQVRAVEAHCSLSFFVCWLTRGLVRPPLLLKAPNETGKAFRDRVKQLLAAGPLFIATAKVAKITSVDWSDKAYSYRTDGQSYGGHRQDGLHALAPELRLSKYVFPAYLVHRLLRATLRYVAAVVSCNTACG